MSILSAILGRSAPRPGESRAESHYDLDIQTAWGSVLNDFDGQDDSKKVRINRHTAMMISAFWRGVNLLAGDVAKLPIMVYRRNGEGKERDKQHPAYALLHNKAHKNLTAFNFKQDLMGHALMLGNGYAWINRDNNGTPIEMIPLDPTMTFPMRVDGELWYVTQRPRTDGKNIEHYRKLDASSVFHLRGLGFDGMQGYNVLQYARRSLGIAAQQDIYATNYFRRGGRPPLALKYPHRLDAAQKETILAGFDRLNGGIDNSHRALVLEYGIDPVVMPSTAEDAQLLESREYSKSDVANWLGLPPHKVGAKEGRSYSSLEQENWSYVTESLDRWLCAFETEAWDKLLTEDEKSADSHVVEFFRNAMLKADIKSRYEAYAIGRNNGWLNADNICAAENLNPLPNEQGQIYLSPLNMQPAQALANEVKRLQSGNATQADQQFMREVLKAMLADKTLNDVIYNLVDVEDLIKLVGLPPEKGEDGEEIQAPWMPVSGDNGQPVTGEALVDEEGDVVGGKTAARSSTPPTGPTPTPPPPAADPADPAPAEPEPTKGDDENGENDERMRILRTAVRSAGDSDVRRMARRLDTSAKRSKVGGGAITCETLESGHGATVRECLLPFARIVCALEGRAQETAAELAAAMARGLFEAFAAGERDEDVLVSRALTAMETTP